MKINVLVNERKNDKVVQKAIRDSNQQHNS
jgi:hypothetical protein